MYSDVVAKMAELPETDTLAAQVVKLIDDTDLLCKAIGEQIKRMHQKGNSLPVAQQIEMQALQQTLETSSQLLSTLCQNMFTLSRVRVQSSTLPVSIAIARGKLN